MHGICELYLNSDCTLCFCFFLFFMSLWHSAKRILSPLFFGGLSNTLNNAKVRCTMNEVTINHLMYADDLVLITLSIHAMQILLHI